MAPPSHTFRLHEAPPSWAKPTQRLRSQPTRRPRPERATAVAEATLATRTVAGRNIGHTNVRSSAMRVSPVRTSLGLTRTDGTRCLRGRIGRPQGSPRHDHRQASCSVTVPQTPPGSPARGGCRFSLRRLTMSRFCRSKPSGRQCSLTPDLGGAPHPRLGTPLRMHSSAITKTPVDLGFRWWQVLGSNQRRLSRRFYRQPSMRTLCGR